MSSHRALMERLQGDELLYKGTTILPSDQGVRLINILAISPLCPLRDGEFRRQRRGLHKPCSTGTSEGVKETYCRSSMRP
ncbi:hypothetical protein HMPREF1556_00913, partial [Porphyromonas sp. oral taxon 278 str. W7784]